MTRTRLPLIGLFVLMCLGTFWGQAPLALGSIHSVTPLATCPNGFHTGATCFSASVTCPNTVDLALTYGVVGTDTTGTIVFFDGGAGTSPGGEQYIPDYLNGGFQIVQAAFQTAWENTQSGSGVSIKTAACRTATFLNYVRQNIYSRGGMCAQGSSAGSGAIGYALAEYGAGSYLDNVELLSGPVFGDIAKGCIVPNLPAVTVCPAGQLGCNDGTEGGWPDPPQYIDGYLTSIRTWTGDSTCNGSSDTSSSSNTKWKDMSIVDGLGDSTFSYPKTAIAGWLCSNTSVNCQGSACQNNSAAEGQFFYEKITSAAQPFSVNRIDKCQGAEGVTGGFVPPNDQETGFTAISNDMLTNCRARH